MIEQNFNKIFEQSIKDHWNFNAFANYESTTVTYEYVARKITQIHQFFKENGIAQGDKIAVMGKSCINWGITYLASTTYGAVIIPVLSEFSPDDVHHIIEHSEAKIFFCSQSILKRLNIKQFSTLNALIALDDFSVMFNAANDVLTVEPKEITVDQFSLPKISNDQLVSILYTSGTSGYSKGVMITYNSLVANIVYAQRYMPLGAGDKIVSFLPIAHSYGCAFEFLYPFTLGCCITFFGKLPSPQLILKAFKEIKPALILSVPLIMEKIVRNKVFPQLEKPSMKFLLKTPILKNIIHKKITKSLRDSFGGEMKEFVIGGAPFDPEIETFLRIIKFPYAVGYGMTECGPLIAYAGHKISKFGSAGRPIDFIEVDVINKNEDGIGEFIVKGENVMLGYYKNEQETKATFTENGWMKTGDLGYIDEDKFIFIKGRSKSLILGPSGKNIFPEEMEAKINTLHCIQESLVVERDNKLVALIKPSEECQNELSQSTQDLVAQKLTEINTLLPKHAQIVAIEIQDKEFEKTPKQSIKRYLYQHDDSTD